MRLVCLKYAKEEFLCRDPVVDQEVAGDFEAAAVASEEARAEADFTAEAASTEEASTVVGTTDLFSAVGGLALATMAAVAALAD